MKLLKILESKGVSTVFQKKSKEILRKSKTENLGKNVQNFWKRVGDCMQ